MIFTPLYWIVLLIVIALILKNTKWKRVFLFLALLVLIIFSNPFLFQHFARWWQPSPVHLRENSHYSFGIVPGGFASVDLDGEGYFNSASDRFLQAVKLYKTGVIDHILISGGNSKKNDKSFTEAAWSKEEMVKFGVPDSVIITEDQSKGTADNAKNSKRILDSVSARPPFILITSAFHLPRAKKLFKQEGMSILPYPCNYTEGRGPVNWKDMIPDLSLLIQWNKYVKESAWWLLH